MSGLSISKGSRRLSEAEVLQFHELGYVKNLPLFDEAGVEILQQQFMGMLEAVPKCVDTYRVNNWHKANRWFYDLTQTSTILDYVEDLLGKHFYQWGGSHFVKYPHDKATTPWHQDARYWPLEPRSTVTVWLAAFDTDSNNGCMRVVPGSHRWGDIDHKEIEGDQNVLWQEVAPGTFTEDQVVDIDLKAGEISLHDDDLIHGSTDNPTDRMRAGITIRFCPTNVKCDLGVWPNFEVYPARGTDRYHYNPVGKIPTKNGYPESFNQKSTDFA